MKNFKTLVVITAFTALLVVFVEAGDKHDYQTCVIGTDLCTGTNSMCVPTLMTEAGNNRTNAT